MSLIKPYYLLFINCTGLLPKTIQVITKVRLKSEKLKTEKPIFYIVFLDKCQFRRIYMEHESWGKKFLF